MDEPTEGEGREELAKTALLFCWLLATICGYYILRPVRTALVMADFGPRMLPWVYMGTALFTGVAVWIYSFFTHLPRRKLLGGVLGFFIGNLVILAWLVGREYKWISPVLYVWTDIFSIMSVTIFWMYANDVLAGKSAKRTFGRVAAAGMVGAVIGAWLTKTFVSGLGMSGMVLVSAGVYALALGCLAALEWLTGGRSVKREKTIERFEEFHFADLRSVLKSVTASRTLSLLVLVVAMERFVPDFVDYIFSTAMHQAYPERHAYAVAFAGFEVWRNVLVFIGAFFLTGPMLKHLGVHAALTAVPVSIALFGGLYAVMPALMIAMLMKGFEEGQRHAWFKAGKEVVYTATSQEVIYKVKAYIEMFVYRLARGVAGLLLLLLTDLGNLGTVGVSIAMLPLAAAWCWATWSLGTDYERLDRERTLAAGRAREAKPSPEEPAQANAVTAPLAGRSPAAPGPEGPGESFRMPAFDGARGRAGLGEFKPAEGPAA